MSVMCLWAVAYKCDVLIGWWCLRRIVNECDMPMDGCVCSDCTYGVMFAGDYTYV